MNIKLDENSNEYKDFVKALEIVNRQIVEINDRAISALNSGSTYTTENLTIELQALLQKRDEVCDYNKETISRILSAENN